MSAHLVNALPEGTQWMYEVKWDGYRVELIKNARQVQLHSRNNRDLTQAYPVIVQAALQIKAKHVILDGEVVALDPQGRPSFQALQHRGQVPNHTLIYYVFDVLQLEDIDLRDLPLTQRRAELRALTDGRTLRVSDELVGSAAAVAAAVRELGLEGVVAKRRDSRYQPGDRSRDWVKMKFQRQQEFIVGGFRPDGEASLDSLAIGYFERSGRLKYAGKVCAGFVAHSRRELRQQLKSSVITDCPFPELPIGKSRWGAGISAEEMHEFRWVAPQLVVQIRFQEWTADGRVRHASYLGARPDKSAADVRRED